jgi:hypothetical protein
VTTGRGRAEAWRVPSALDARVDALASRSAMRQVSGPVVPARWDPLRGWGDSCRRLDRLGLTDDQGYSLGYQRPASGTIDAWRATGTI